MEFNLLVSFKNAIYLTIKMVVIIISVMILFEWFEGSKLYNKDQKFFNKPLNGII